MTRSVRARLRRPPAADPARLAAAAPAAERAVDVEDAPWYRISDVRLEVVGEQTGDGVAATASRADVYVYDFIGGWRGSNSENFVRDVAGLDVDELHVHLNSPGGDAFEGITIANVLRQHRAAVTIWVDGLAASAASVIAMAGDEVVMGIGAMIMIHDASSYAWGNAADLRATAEVLDSLSNAVAAAYATKAGGTAAEWRTVMVEEKWYGGEDAVTVGLADRVATADDHGSASGEQVVPGNNSGSLWDWWDVAGAPQQHADIARALYAHTPPALVGRQAGTTRPQALGVSYDVGDRVRVSVDPPHAEGQDTGTVAEVGTTAYGVVFDAMPEMGVHRWYVASELTPEAPSAEEDMAMSMKKKTPKTPKKPAPGMSVPQTPATSAGGSNRNPERSTPVAFSDAQLTTMRQQLGLAEDANEATIVAALTEALEERAEELPKNAIVSTMTVPEGMKLVEGSVLEDLKSKAEAGVRAEQRQMADRREQLVAKAMSAGKIRAADRSKWLNNLEKDPEGFEATLAALEPGLIPVDERGHDQGGAAEGPEQPVSLKAVRESAAYQSWEV